MRGLTTFAVLLAGVLGQCTEPVQRRELKSLQPAERDRFLTALQTLHKKRNRTRLSRYDRYTKIHNDNKEQGHGHPQFLPWHRQFIRNLEKDLQRIDRRVVLPYWDWSTDAASPEQSYIFGSEYMGGNGRGSQGCIGDGPFKTWMMAVPEPHCLARDFDGGDTISPFVSRKVISGLLHINDFSKFSERLEVAHGSIHNNIGGERGDMSPMWSPNE